MVKSFFSLRLMVEEKIITIHESSLDRMPYNIGRVC